MLPSSPGEQDEPQATEVRKEPGEMGGVGLNLKEKERTGCGGKAVAW